MNKLVSLKKTKRGFTIIEVSLFLAISGLLFAFVISDTAGRTARHRYNDTVTDLVEEIRNAYSATANVANERTVEDASFFCSITTAFNEYGGLLVNSPTNDFTTSTGKKTDNQPGRTRCAIYGQLITFGEPTDESDSKKDAISVIRRYTVVGLAAEGQIDTKNAIGSDDVLKSLEAVGANIVTIKQKDSTISNNTECSVSTIGNSAAHKLQWTGRVENRNDRNTYRGAILIARSPISGTIHTYLYSYYGENFDNTDGVALRDNPSDDSAFLVQDWLKSISSNNPRCSSLYNPSGYFVNKAIRSNQFIKDKQLDLCVGSEDLPTISNKRRAVRIHGGGSTESSVELLSEADSLTTCKVVE